jgi:hypothetical protein
MVGDNGSAEEAVREAFARIQPKPGSLQRSGANLRTIVVNECRNVQRRCHLRARDGQRFEFRSDLRSAALPVGRAAILPTRQRQVVALRFYADLFGCRPGMAKSALRRALSSLREVIPMAEEFAPIGHRMDGAGASRVGSICDEQQRRRGLRTATATNREQRRRVRASTVYVARATQRFHAAVAPGERWPDERRRPGSAGTPRRLTGR